MSRTFRKRTRNGVNDQKKLKIRILSEFFRCILRQVWYSNISRVDKVHKIHIDFFFRFSESAGGTEEAEPAEPEGPKEMTLDEWKALQTKEHDTKAKSTFNIRKAGEGVDDAQWKKTYVLSKKKQPHSEEEEEEESDEVSLKCFVQL